MVTLSLPGTNAVRQRIIRHSNRIEFSWERDTVSKKAPISIEIHPTNRCNLKCVFCSYNDIRMGEYLSNDAFRDLITDLIQCRDTVKSVMFSGGGEPSVHPYLPEAINRLVDSGIKVGVITNGVHISEKLMKAYLRCSWIRVSIDVPWESTYIKYISPHKPENFQKVIKNCKTLSDNKKLNKQSGPTLGLAYIMTKDCQTDDAFLKCIDIGVEAGVDYIMYRPLLDMVDMQINRPVSELRQLKKILDDYAKKVGMTHQFTHFLEEFETSSKKEVLTTNKKCPIVNDGLYAYVAATGDVLPCYAIYKDENTKEWSYGNINKDRFINIWEDDLREEIIKKIDASKCPFCRFQVQNEILTNLDLNKVNDFEIINDQDEHIDFL